MLTKNTSELRLLVEEHIAADRVIQGTYWNDEENKGGFIGCLNHSYVPWRAEERFGLSVMIQRIAGSIFEELPEDDAKGFFAALPEAVRCDGKDLSKVGWQFLVAQLRGLPEVPKHIQDVIDPVIEGMDLLAEGKEWADADADAARAATLSATLSADAKAAARAADYAAYAARAATLSANLSGIAALSAAHAAYATALAADDPTGARLKQRDLLLQLISDAPVLPVSLN